MATTLAMVTGLSGLSEMVPSPSLVRPPGVFQEDEFLKRCIRCRACADACPVRGIGLAHLEQGLRNVGTPVLAVPDRYCMIFKGLEKPSARLGAEWKSAHENGELCSECIQVCPTGALQHTNLDQLHLGTAVVYKDHCLAWQYLNCAFPCIDVCVFDAITVATGPVVDARKCVGCNQCSFVCPPRLLGHTGIMVEVTPANE